MKPIALVPVLLLFTLAASRASADEPPAPPAHRRVGIIVGANATMAGVAAPRFADDDARAMADVLVRVGGFAPADVHLLLDPTASALLAAIDDVARSATADTLVFFYYSGGREGPLLYPGGEALPVSVVRDHLASMSGGVLLQGAHETDDAGSSVFAQRFSAGLLGPADANGDGKVTLEEAYGYARDRAPGVDAPAPAAEAASLEVQILGARDLVLSPHREREVAVDVAPWQAPRVSSLSLWSATPGDRWLLHLGVGLGTQTWPLANGGANAANGHYSESVSFGGQLWYRVTDRLSWNVPFPAFAYRFGNPGSVEVMPSIGLKLNSLSTSAGPSFGFSTDVNALIWTAPNQRITLGAGVYVPAYKDTTSPLVAGIGMGNVVDPSVRAGYSWTIQRTVTVHAELGYTQDYYRGTLSSVWVQPRGGVDLRLSPNASLNLGALYSDEVRQNLGSYENFTLGTTISF